MCEDEHQHIMVEPTGPDVNKGRKDPCGRRARRLQFFPARAARRPAAMPPIPGGSSASSLSRSTKVSILASSLTLGAADYEWRDDAICRDTDPELFFPVGTTGHALVQIDRAKEVCEECSVSKQCLDFALETNQDSGIWGGLTEEERRVIRRRRVVRQCVQPRSVRLFCACVSCCCPFDSASWCDARGPGSVTCIARWCD